TAGANWPSTTESALIFAGMPSACAYGGTTVPFVTTAFAPTSECGPTTHRCSTIDPDPTSECGSMVHPSRWALWPITQSGPITVASSCVACTTVPSCTDVRAPTTIRP